MEKVDWKVDSKKEIYKEEWQRDKHTITISKYYFEHLLNCLANQKFIGEKPPNEDAMELGESKYNEVQIENQKVIDKAWNQGMFLCTLDYKKNDIYAKMKEKYVKFWNRSFSHIEKMIKEDKEEHKGDENIVFKWSQLVPQEIEMWMSLCCGSYGIIDLEECSFKSGNVSLEDLRYIVDRRGFTNNMRNFLILALKEIGIGDKLD